MTKKIIFSIFSLLVFFALGMISGFFIKSKSNTQSNNQELLQAVNKPADTLPILNDPVNDSLNGVPQVPTTDNVNVATPLPVAPISTPIAPVVPPAAVVSTNATTAPVAQSNVGIVVPPVAPVVNPVAEGSMSPALLAPPVVPE